MPLLHFKYHKKMKIKSCSNRAPEMVFENLGFIRPGMPYPIKRGLRRAVCPNQEQCRRTDRSLQLWLLEAKNIAPKKKYFCEVCLDGQLYARTCSREKKDLLFWGESFEFRDLGSIKNITVNLYREAEKKKRKDKNALIARVDVPVGEITCRQLSEKWYASEWETVGGKVTKEMKGDAPLVRLKARFLAVNVLPMASYQPLLNYLLSDYTHMVQVFEGFISLKCKEELGRGLVYIMHRLGRAQQFLADAVMVDVDRIDNQALLFRGNSIATKAMEAYMKLVGEKYLHDTLTEFVSLVSDSKDDCEVDPSRVASPDLLPKHQKNLIRYCETFWRSIETSHHKCPSELRAVFGSVREQCRVRSKEPVADNLISASIFLRFLCPAILSPSLFGLTQEFPQERVARNLTLIAKTIQTLANFTRFGGKEDYMVFMNQFVESKASSMRQFLQNVSTPSGTAALCGDAEGAVDPGLQLALLHEALEDCFTRASEAVTLKFSPLQQLLANLRHELDNPSTPDPVTHIIDPVTQLHGTHFPVSTPTSTLSSSEHGSSSRTETPDILRNSNSTLHSEHRLSRDVDYDNLGSPISPMDPEMLRLSSAVEARRSYRNIPRTMAMRRELDFVTAEELLSSSLAATATRPSRKPLPEEPPEETPKLSARATNPTSRNYTDRTWDRMLRQAERAATGDCVQLVPISPSAETPAGDGGDSSTELDDWSSSLSQLSNVASSGYHSFGYSQSSSPVDNSSAAAVLENLRDPAATLELSRSQPNSGSAALSFSNPVFSRQGSSSGSGRRPDRFRSAVSSTSSTGSQGGWGSSRGGQRTGSGTRQNEGRSSGRARKTSATEPVPVAKDGSRSAGVVRSSSGHNRIFPTPSSQYSGDSSSERQPLSTPSLSLARPTPPKAYHNETPTLPARITSTSINPRRSPVVGQNRASPDLRTGHPSWSSSSGSETLGPYPDLITARIERAKREGNEAYQQQRQERRKLSSGSCEPLQSPRRLKTSSPAAEQQFSREQQRLNQQILECQRSLQTQPPSSSSSAPRPDANASAMTSILERLARVEEQLKCEKDEMENMINQKQQIIEHQQRRIAELELKNTFNGSTGQSTGRNGVIDGPPANQSKLCRTEFDQFKSSPC